MKRLHWTLAALLLAGCGGKETAPPPVADERPAPSDQRPVIVAFGDSLTAGYGVEPGRSYPAFLQAELDKAGFGYRVVNAGISGDTTSGGLSRASTVAAMKPAIVILALGGNDGLRGLPAQSTRANLEKMTLVFKESGAQVVLAGMTLPRNYGPDYIREFEKVFDSVAAQHAVPLIPFLLEGVAGREGLMQNDAIHPTAEGNRLVARNVMRVLKPLLQR